MKKTYLVIFFGIILLCLTGCKLSEKENYKINVNADENIKAEAFIDYTNENLIVYLTNNNNYNIGSFDVEAIYYDEKGNKMGDDSTTQLNFISGGNYAVELYLPSDSIPDKIDLNIKIDKEYQRTVTDEKLYNDKITTSYKKDSEEVKVDVKNTSNKELYVEASVLFKKKGKPIYIENLRTYIDSNKTESETVEIPEDYEKSEKQDKDVLIDFDSIEIVVNRAIEE